MGLTNTAITQSVIRIVLFEAKDLDFWHRPNSKYSSITYQSTRISVFEATYFVLFLEYILVNNE